MLKRKLLLVTLFASMTIGVTGCGGSSQEEAVQESVVVEEAAEAENVQEETDEAESEDAEGNEAESTEEAGEQGKLEEFFDLSAYESYGAANGGIIPVKVNGLWGAVNYEGVEIVPCQYDGFYYAPNEKGYFVLDNCVVTEKQTEFGTTYESKDYTYFLFGPDGKLIYEGKDQVMASANFYAVKKIDWEYPKVEYYDYSGNNFLTTEVYDQTVVDAFGAYEGVATVYRSSDNGNNNMHDETSEIGILKEDNTVEWNPKVFYTDKQPISSVNHGYFVANNYAFEHGEVELYSEDCELISKGHLGCIELEGDTVKIVDYGQSNLETRFSGFFHDGEYIYNYGSKVIVIVGEKYVLVDLALCPGMTTDTMSEEIVTAVYDRIYMADANYWRVRKGEQWGYIDHDGNEAVMFDGAVSNFIDGYALILKDGKACLIDETFEVVHEYGPAEEVGNVGEFLAITVDGKDKLLKLN